MRAKKTDLRYVLFLCITKLTIELLSLDYFPLALKSLNKCVCVLAMVFATIWKEI